MELVIILKLIDYSFLIDSFKFNFFLKFNQQATPNLVADCVNCVAKIKKKYLFLRRTI